MVITRIKKIKKTVEATAESCRGLSMSAFTCLSDAATLLQKAVLALEEEKKRPKSAPLNLDTVMGKNGL